MYSRSVGLAPPATYPTLQRSGGNTTLPNTAEDLVQLLQHELNTQPLDQAELVYRNLGRIYSILQRLERDTFNHFTKSLLNSVVQQLEVYINALNIDETKGDDLSQIVTLIRGVILRSKVEYFKPNPKPKKTPVGWG